MLHATNTLLSNADKRNVSVLSLLRLSSGFYTLDHQILVCWLQATFGIYNTANDRFSPDMACVLSFWFRFKNPTSQVRCPPVLGTVLFTRYTRPLWTLNTTEIITSTLTTHSSKTMLLPAKSLWLSLAQNSVLVHFTHGCSVRKLNGDQTEVLCSCSRHSISQVSETSLRLNGGEIPFKAA